LACWARKLACNFVRPKSAYVLRSPGLPFIMEASCQI
jgi:hypothetical protein